VIAVVAAPLLVAALAQNDDQSKALALIEQLGGRYYTSDKPGKPVVFVALLIRLPITIRTSALPHGISQVHPQE
jgi:hypothetical protein